MIYNGDKEKIIQYLNIKEVILRYSETEVDRHNRCACPLHNGINHNLAVYPKTNSFYCFNCGAGGDLIKFVSLYLNISYHEAMQKIDRDYNLGIFKNRHKTYNAVAKETAKLNKKHKEKQSYMAWQQFSYCLLINYLKWLQRQPKTNAIEFDINYVERLLDKHLNLEENPIEINVKSLIRALHTKHRKEVTHGEGSQN